MKSKEMEVKTANGESWTLTIEGFPESYEEATQRFGERAAFDMLASDLTTRLQNQARDMFRKGKSREEVEEATRNYQPGGGKGSKKQSATELIMKPENAEAMANDPSLKNDVQEAFRSNDWDTVINLLS